ncbi:unnamed protein product [Ectocarpus sp. 12 AP-2014]
MAADVKISQDRVASGVVQVQRRKLFHWLQACGQGSDWGGKESWWGPY